MYTYYATSFIIYVSANKSFHLKLKLTYRFSYIRMFHNSNENWLNILYKVH